MHDFKWAEKTVCSITEQISGIDIGLKSKGNGVEQPPTNQPKNDFPFCEPTLALVSSVKPF